MIWQIGEGAAAVSMRVPDDFVIWLVAEVRDPRLHQLDPYRDYSLDGAAQRAWAEELERLKQSRIATIRDVVNARASLPRDRQARENVLSSICRQEIERDATYATLMELSALIAIALESAMPIRLFGDSSRHWATV